MRRLTPATATLIMLSTVVGLIAAYFVKGLFAVEERSPWREARNLPMAIADIPPGTRISESHLAFRPYPAAERRSKLLLDHQVIVGRTAKKRIPAATPILAEQLYLPGVRPPLQVADGMRAKTVELRSAAAIVDGFVRPGQFVDVHFTITGHDGSADDRISGGLTITLCKAVRVLAINRSLRQVDVSESGNAVTLELTPAQVGAVTLAETCGQLSLSYNPGEGGDGGIVLADADRATLDDLLRTDPPPSSPSPAPLPKHEDSEVIEDSQVIEDADMTEDFDAIEHFRGARREVIELPDGKPGEESRTDFGPADPAP